MTVGGGNFQDQASSVPEEVLAFASGSRRWASATLPGLGLAWPWRRQA